jgi:outer membrane biosynthesis protein TonB
METRRTTLSLGPLEVSFRRRDDPLRLGILGSLIAHVLFILILTFVVPHQRAAVETDSALKISPPVPITFVDPSRRITPPQPKPKPPEFDARKPPPPTAKPLRMQPAPESVAEITRESKQPTISRNGRSDSRPAGGEAGGPLTSPTPGVPVQGEAASNPDEPKDILGRLREFKKAVETPRPSASKGQEGGGHGSGGVSMPNLPSTGFGVGNLEFEGRDFDWENYGRQIHGIIWRAWHNRLLITSSVFERWAAENRQWALDHRNGVRFTILRTGQVVDVEIETPSGCYPLDDSATDALKEVVLPPLPADFQRESETVHARFIAEGEIRTMKGYLQQLKNAGYF